MTKEVVYRCKNTGGPDGDCEHAAGNEDISASLVTINNNGEAICPGKTVFDDPCGSVLEEVIPPKKLPLGMIAGSVGGLALVAGAIWMFALKGDALLRMEQTTVTLSPGQSAKVALFNDGEANLTLDDVIFSIANFSVEDDAESVDIAPGESGFIRVKFAPNVQNSVQGTMTIDSNSASGPVSIKLVGNTNVWNVAEKLNSQSTILGKE